MAKRELGLKIRKCRTKLGLSQRELAQRLNVTPQAVWYWEHHYRVPNLKNVWDLCNALAIPFDEMVAVYSSMI